MSWFLPETTGGSHLQILPGMGTGNGDALGWALGAGMLWGGHWAWRLLDTGTRRSTPGTGTGHRDLDAAISRCEGLGSSPGPVRQGSFLLANSRELMAKSCSCGRPAVTSPSQSWPLQAVGRIPPSLPLSPSLPIFPPNPLSQPHCLSKMKQEQKQKQKQSLVKVAVPVVAGDRQVAVAIGGGGCRWWWL